jgi:hypothetical protein
MTCTAFGCRLQRSNVHAIAVLRAPKLTPGRSTLCKAAASDMPQALLFDCDGVLVDTERDGHRVAFNQAFKKMGLPHEWDVETYGRLLATGAALVMCSVCVGLLQKSLKKHC